MSGGILSERLRDTAPTAHKFQIMAAIHNDWHKRLRSMIRSGVRQMCAFGREWEGNDARVALGTGTALQLVSSCFAWTNRQGAIASSALTYLSSRTRRAPNAESRLERKKAETRSFQAVRLSRGTFRPSTWPAYAPLANPPDP